MKVILSSAFTEIHFGKGSNLYVGYMSGLMITTVNTEFQVL